MGAETLFQAMGYKNIGNGVLVLDGPVCPDRVSNMSRDCLVAYVECQILKHIWEEVSAVFHVSWLDILENRVECPGNIEQCVNNITYKYNAKRFQPPMRSARIEQSNSASHGSLPNNLVHVPKNPSYVTALVGHNHVSLPQPLVTAPVPFCLPHTNGCASTYTYGYGTYAPQMPIVNQPLASVNGFYFPNGPSAIQPAYQVPTAQLIEFEKRNGHDLVDEGSASRSRRPRLDSNGTLESDRGSKIAAGSGQEDKQAPMEEDWDYVFRNLEQQGYSKDLGERGDVLGLSSGKHRKYAKEAAPRQRVRTTNLDEALNSLTVSDRPLKMTEALEHMEKKTLERNLPSTKERRHSQGSSYENVIGNEGPKPALTHTNIQASYSSSAAAAPKIKLPKESAEVTQLNAVEEKKRTEPEKRNYRSKRNKPTVGQQAKEVLESLDENNRVIKLFRAFAVELDEKHDRHERIVKLGRDITIEAKRIIFLLHNISTDIEEKRNSVLEEAKSRLSTLCSTNFKAIALELRRHDGYLYHRAFTAGMQEFIEALCFYQYIKQDSIGNWVDINRSFQFEDEDQQKIQLLFTQYDFILGIADFTGELMRKCINTLGSGNVSDCFKLCNFVRAINTGFLGLSYSGNREVSRKTHVLRQSLAKMELVCYNIQIRGSEVPKHMLLSVIESQEADNNDDEGFCI
ncbi:hypothetical protein D910_08298 [Dendroctonus ponderosae]|uniref:Translin n=1 Tax=Dendroctonus ponderosae TaxID=77166 RepID=U4ULA7_DENPD|nr:hypothetical protein D910_08298 [Dendroctonus ponderosae]